VPEVAKPESLAAALAQLQGQLPKIGKDKTARVTSQRTGKTHTYDYANLTKISERILPLMSKLGLSFSCRPTMEGDRFVLAYELRHTSDEIGVGGAYPLPAGGSPQEIGSAITYARRYCLCAVTGVSPDEDDDDAQAAEQARATANQAPEVNGRGEATFAEQTRMVSGAVPGTERLAAVPADDRWYGVAAGAAKDPVEDLPGSSLPAQRQAVFLALKDLDLTSPADQRGFCSGITGREITSRTDLSYTEAAAVIAAAKDRMEPAR
jgi:hypothetical protein